MYELLVAVFAVLCHDFLTHTLSNQYGYFIVLYYIILFFFYYFISYHIISYVITVIIQLCIYIKMS